MADQDPMAVTTVAATITVSRQMLEDSDSFNQIISDVISGRRKLPPPRPEPVDNPVLVTVPVRLASPEEAALLVDRCLCGHLEVVHHRDTEYGDDCRLCRCTDYRQR